MSGIYISYPFCSQKCTYCNFASGVFPRSLERTYQEALLHEIETRQWNWQPDTLYLGGGTPSSMDVEDLHQLLEALPTKTWREATIETAPGTLSEEKAIAWRRAGINRVSLGVQSFVQAELARTGRRHTAQTVESDIQQLRASGIENINVDLIAGLPMQTAASWRESLDWIKRLDPPHVSIYMLEIDEDSRLGAEILLGGKRYAAMDAPSEDLTATLYETAVQELAAMGLARYEISNFAKAGKESLHNLKYWRAEPYLGFGADAHSLDGGRRWQNVESPSEYVERWTAGLSPRSASIQANAQEEKFFVGLRLTEGIQPTREEWLTFRDPIRRFVDDGLMEREGPNLRLTGRGVMLSNEIFQEFLA